MVAIDEKFVRKKAEIKKRAFVKIFRNVRYIADYLFPIR